MKHKKHIIFIDYSGNSRTLCKRKTFNDGIYVWRLYETIKDLKEYDEYILKHHLCKNCFKNYLKNISGEIKQY